MATKTLRDKSSGQFRGSIGDGKTHAPTVSPKIPTKNNAGNRFDREATQVTVALIDESAVSSNFDRRQRAAGREPIDALVAEWLATDENTAVVQFVAINPTISENLRIRLSTDSRPKVRSAAVNSWKLPLSRLEELANDPEVEVRLAVANSDNISEDLLGKLAKDLDVNVRYQVALNSITPGNVLDVLAADRSYDVRGATAENRNTHPIILDMLAQDSSPWVRRRVAQSKMVSVDTLDVLADDSDEEVVMEVINNNRTSTRTLEKIRSYASSADLRYEAVQALDQRR